MSNELQKDATVIHIETCQQPLRAMEALWPIGIWEGNNLRVFQETAFKEGKQAFCLRRTTLQIRTKMDIKKRS